MSQLRRAFAVSAILLCAVAGLTFGLFAPSALADDPPPTTVPTPTLPAPDPAPPKPKPAPAPKPKPVTHTTRQVRTTPVYHAPTPAPVTPTRPAPTVRTHVKPKKKARHKKAVVKKKVVPTTTTTATLPTVPVSTNAGAVGVRSAFHTKSGGSSLSVSSIVIVLGLGIAIACFAVALVPARALRWRPAAIFVYERQVDLTLVGLGLLVLAAFTFFLTKGS